MKASGSGGAVVLSSQAVGLASSIPDGLISLAIGLLGVVLARWVFVNREQRRLGRKESWSETLPITLVGALVAGVIIWDRDLGFSSAAFVGLGVGWATVLILEVAGARISQAMQTLLGHEPPPDFPRRADLSGHDGKVDSGLIDPDNPADGGPSFAKLVDKLDEDPKGKKP